MFAIPSTTVSSTEYTDAQTFQANFAVAQGFLVVGTSAVYAQLLKGTYGAPAIGEELYLSPGTYPIFGGSREPIAGIRVKAADATALDPNVSGAMYGIGEPGIAANQLASQAIGASRGFSYFQVAVTAAANTANAGKWWLPNVNTDYKVQVDRVSARSQVNGTFAHAPEFHLQRMIFVGVNGGGGSITPAIDDSDGPALLQSIRTTVSGASITAGDIVAGHTVPAASVAIPGSSDGGELLTFPVVLHKGEGLIFRQDSAGDSSDTRTVDCCVSWLELPQGGYLAL